MPLAKPSEPPTDPTCAILQFKIRLMGISPMIWRRVLVPATFTVRQLHGVVAMGWEGIHLFQFRLRAARSRLLLRGRSFARRSTALMRASSSCGLNGLAM